MKKLVSLLLTLTLTLGMLTSMMVSSSAATTYKIPYKVTNKTSSGTKTITYNYDASSKTVTVSDTTGRIFFMNPKNVNYQNMMLIVPTLTWLTMSKEVQNGKIKTFKIGDGTTYTFKTSNKRVTKCEYTMTSEYNGDHCVHSYTYDSDGNVKTVTWDRTDGYWHAADGYKGVYKFTYKNGVLKSSKYTVYYEGMNYDSQTWKETYTTDSKGRVTKITTEDGSTTTFSYNSNGKPKNASGYTLTYSNGRIATAKSSSENTEMSCTYQSI